MDSNKVDVLGIIMTWCDEEIKNKEKQLQGYLNNENCLDNPAKTIIKMKCLQSEKTMLEIVRGMPKDIAVKLKQSEEDVGEK
jgi:hypothetical protein